MQNLITIATLWGVPRTCGVLYEKPANENDCFFRIRHRISDLLQNGYETLGEKERFFVKEIIGDNAWISALAFSILLNKDLIATDHLMEGVLAIVSGSAFICCTHSGLAHALYHTQPSIASFIAPRYVSNCNAIN